MCTWFIQTACSHVIHLYVAVCSNFKGILKRLSPNIRLTRTHTVQQECLAWGRFGESFLNHLTRTIIITLMAGSIELPNFFSLTTFNLSILQTLTPPNIPAIWYIYAVSVCADCYFYVFIFKFLSPYCIGYGDVKALSRDIGSCTATLYSKLKTECRALVELAMDCQVLVWIIHCFYVDPVLAFTVNHVPSLCASDRSAPPLLQHVNVDGLHMQNLQLTTGLHRSRWVLHKSSHGYSCARPIYSGVVTYRCPGMTSVVYVQKCVLFWCCV